MTVHADKLEVKTSVAFQGWKGSAVAVQCGEKRSLPGSSPLNAFMLPRDFLQERLYPLHE
jgi:hypothetical protein